MAEALSLRLWVYGPQTQAKGKHTLVSNSRLACAMVQKHMAYAGVHIQVEAYARNLAVFMAAGSFR